MKNGSTSGGTNWKQLLGLVALMVAVGFAWNTWFVYPLKILVVFFHELSHGLMAMATGGAIREIRLAAQEGGLCVTSGGNRFLVLSAGYLGSLVMGGIILLLATRTRHDKLLVWALGALMVAIALLFVRPLISFGFLFCLVIGAALIAAGSRLPEDVNDFILKTVGLTSCLYAVLDISSDILTRPELRSDARMLAEHTHIPTLVWGVVWMGIALAAAVFFLVVACRGQDNGEDPSRQRRNQFWSS